jgi:hypothetical protein
LLCREQSSRAISVIAGVDVCLFPLWKPWAEDR